MRIVITGASGNVGTALLRRLSSDPDLDLVGVSRRPPSLDPPFTGVQWYPIDLAQPDATTQLGAAMTGADAVVHLAWVIQPSHDRDAMERVNRGGTRAVVDAAVAAGVQHLVVASSVGTYAPTLRRERLDESHPATGVPVSRYSSDKAWVEHLLDRVEAKVPEMAVSRVRSAIVMNEDAASEVTSYFLGPLLSPARVLLGRLPVVPVPAGMHLQLVHADDLADAYVRILRTRAAGAYNIAGEPVLDTSDLAHALGGRRLPLPSPLLMAGASLTWRLRIQPVDAGWIAMGAAVPMMSTERARDVLGWAPTVDSREALESMLAAMRDRRGLDQSPALAA